MVVAAVDKRPGLIPLKRHWQGRCIVLAKNNFMIAKDILDIDLYELAQKTKIPIKRLVSMQRLTNQIIS